jgi:hypothetical protein
MDNKFIGSDKFNSFMTYYAKKFNLLSPNTLITTVIIMIIDNYKFTNIFTTAVIIFVVQYYIYSISSISINNKIKQLQQSELDNDDFIIRDKYNGFYSFKFRN